MMSRASILPRWAAVTAVGILFAATDRAANAQATAPGAQAVAVPPYLQNKLPAYNYPLIAPRTGPAFRPPVISPPFSNASAVVTPSGAKWGPSLQADLIMKKLWSVHLFLIQAQRDGDFDYDGHRKNADILVRLAVVELNADLGWKLPVSPPTSSGGFSRAALQPLLNQQLQNAGAGLVIAGTDLSVYANNSPRVRRALTLLQGATREVQQAILYAQVFY